MSVVGAIAVDHVHDIAGKTHRMAQHVVAVMQHNVLIQHRQQNDSETDSWNSIVSAHSVEMNRTAVLQQSPLYALP